MVVPEKYLYFPNGVKKAILVHILRPGECPKKWERLPNHFTDKREVYKRIT